MKRKKTLKVGFRRIILMSVILALLVSVFVFTVSAEEPDTPDTPTYFNIENEYEFDDEGKVELIFSSPAPDGVSIVIFVKNIDDDTFECVEEKPLDEGATSYIYEVGDTNGARKKGATIYAAITNYTDADQFEDLAEDETTEYAILTRTVIVVPPPCTHDCGDSCGLGDNCSHALCNICKVEDSDALTNCPHSCEETCNCVLAADEKCIHADCIYCCFETKEKLVLQVIEVLPEPMPVYFNTDNEYVFNDEGKVELIFNSPAPDGASIVIFIWNSTDKIFECVEVKPLDEGATSYIYEAGDIDDARKNGAKIYAAITNYTDADQFEDLAEDETTEYAILTRTVTDVPPPCTHDCGDSCGLGDNCSHALCNICKVEDSDALTNCPHSCEETCNCVLAADEKCIHADCIYCCFETEEWLVLQAIKVQPEPPFSFEDNVLSMTVEKDIAASNGGTSKYHVKTGDTVVVTLELKGVAPKIDETNSEVGGNTGTWTSEVLGDDPDKSIKWTGIFIVSDVADQDEQKDLKFEIKIIDSFNKTHEIKEKDTTYPVSEMEPVLLLGKFTAESFEFTCENSDPYDAPYGNIIYAGETMNITIGSNKRDIQLVSYRVGSSGDKMVTTKLSDEHAISYLLKPSECPNGGGELKVWFTLKDEAGTEIEISLPSKYELSYEESSGTSTVLIEGPNPQYNGTFYVKQGDTLTITVIAAQNQNKKQKNVSFDVWGNTVDLTFEDKQDGKWVYTGTVSLDNCIGYDDLDLLTYSFTGKQSWTNSDIPLEVNIKYLKELTVDSVLMRSNNSYNMQYAIDGETVIAKVKFNHTELVRDTDALFTIAGVVATNKTGITDCDLIVPDSNEAIYYYDSANNQFIVKYTLPVPDEAGYQVKVTDDQPIDLLVKAEDVAGNKFAETSILPLVTKQVKYYAPLEITTEVDSGNGNIDTDGYLAARNGETYTMTIYSNHLLELSRTALDIIGKSGGNFTLVSSSTSRYIYEAKFTINSAPLVNVGDFTILSVGYTVYDLAGQDVAFDPETDNLDAGSWGRYYAPIEITDVVIESSNIKNKALYAKDGDMITVTFTSNHMVDVAGLIVGKTADISFVTIKNSNNIKWTIKYILQNGDLPDLATVGFVFTANDAAKNDEVKYTQESGGVTNRLKYYAPIKATAGIVSNNVRPIYAKNGDTLTVTCDAQHEVAAIEYQIGRFNFTNPETYINDPLKLILAIPSGESSMSEGIVMFWIQLIDPAGNTLRVAETTDKSQVIYDRTAPEVQFAPAFNGATNDDVYLSIVYSDLYLDLYTVSFTVNDFERIPSNLKVNESEPATTFTHQITVFSEGEYYCTGTITDMAGNKSVIGVSCSFIVDKTNPSVSIKLNPNTFPGGLCLDSIFSADDELLGDIICTVTEDSGVHDWTLNEPMTVEGRKTVLLIAKDIAGNYSVPITCDIYIDTTAPQPTVRETTRGAVLGRVEENRITVQNGMLGVSLAAIHMGDEKPDIFTRLELLDEDGNVVANLLADGVSADGLYYVDLPGRGNYTLVMEAEDGVGNKTDVLRYDIIYRPTQWWLIVILGVVGLIAITVLGVYIAKRRKESQ